MAVVSVNRILTTKDRAVLEWEYDNIINRLAFGNIESDSEMVSLYQELMTFATGKRLRQEEAYYCAEFPATWNLLRRYHLPDEYRLTGESLGKFFKAMEAENSSARLKMLQCKVCPKCREL